MVTSKLTQAVLNTYSRYYKGNDLKLTVIGGTPLANILSNTFPKNLDKVGTLDDESVVGVISTNVKEEALAIHIQEEIDSYGEAIADRITNNIEYALNTVLPYVVSFYEDITSRIHTESGDVIDLIHFKPVSLPAIVDLELFDEYIGKTSKDAHMDKTSVFDPGIIYKTADDEDFKKIFTTGIPYIDDIINGTVLKGHDKESVSAILYHAYHNKQILDNRLDAECKLEASIISFLFYRGVSNLVDSDGNINNENVYRCNVAMSYWGQIINQQVREYRNAVKKDKLFYMEGTDPLFIDGGWEQANGKRTLNITVYNECFDKVQKLGISGAVCGGAAISGHNLEELTLDSIAKNSSFYLNAWERFSGGQAMRRRLTATAKLSYDLKSSLDGIVGSIRENPPEDFRGDLQELAESRSVENYIHQIVNHEIDTDIYIIAIKIVAGHVFSRTDAANTLQAITFFGDGKPVVRDQDVADLVIKNITKFILGQVQAG